MSQPFFISIPRTTTAVTSDVSTRTGVGATALFIADPISGSKIDYINVNQTGVITSAIRFSVFLCDANGNNPIMIRDWGWGNNNPLTANLGNSFRFNFTNGMYLGTNSSIYVGQTIWTNSNDNLHWVAVGADL